MHLASYISLVNKERSCQYHSLLGFLHTIPEEELDSTNTKMIIMAIMIDSQGCMNNAMKQGVTQLILRISRLQSTKTLTVILSN